MKRGLWLAWWYLVASLCLALAVTGCNTSLSGSGNITVSGTVKTDDGKVPVAFIEIVDSNSKLVAKVGITDIRSDTGAYQAILAGPGLYSFRITATNEAGRNISKTTGNLTLSGNTTLNFTLSPAAASAANPEDKFDIGSGNQTLLPA